MKRREFIAGLGSAAASSVAPRAQRGDRMRRIGVMLGTLLADDPETQARVTAFVQGLQEFGWTDGRKVRTDYRWVWPIQIAFVGPRRNLLRSLRMSSSLVEIWPWWLFNRPAERCRLFLQTSLTRSASAASARGLPLRTAAM
jgi:hypothetical protein